MIPKGALTIQDIKEEDLNQWGYPSSDKYRFIGFNKALGKPLWRRTRNVSK